MKINTSEASCWQSCSIIYYFQSDKNVEGLLDIMTMGLCDLQIESLLDESTAELAKFEFAPLCTTAEASFKFKKAVPLNTTLQIDCKVICSSLTPIAKGTAIRVCKVCLQSVTDRDFLCP